VHIQGSFQRLEQYRVTTGRIFVDMWSCRWNFTSTKIKVKLNIKFHLNTFCIQQMFILPEIHTWYKITYISKNKRKCKNEVLHVTYLVSVEFSKTG
jgi:hypothetical protein